MRAPSVLSLLYVGKERLPTLQFNVSCDHALKIVHVAGSAGGRSKRQDMHYSLDFIEQYACFIVSGARLRVRDVNNF